MESQTRENAMEAQTKKEKVCVALSPESIQDMDDREWLLHMTSISNVMTREDLSSLLQSIKNSNLPPDRMEFRFQSLLRTYQAPFRAKRNYLSCKFCDLINGTLIKAQKKVTVLKGGKRSVTKFQPILDDEGHEIYYHQRCVNKELLMMQRKAEALRKEQEKVEGKPVVSASISGLTRPKSTKLTSDQVKEIRASSESNSKTAKLYGVGKSTISDIRTRKTWKNI